MSQTKLHRLISLFLASFLLMTAPLAVLAQDAEGDAAAESTDAEADTTEEAPAEEESAEEQPAAPSVVRAKVVTGSLPGNQFAQTWLQLVPDFPDASIQIMVDWSVPNAGSKGLQFSVLDPSNLNRVIGGTPLNDVNAIAKGNPVFQGPDNQMDATLRAGGLTNYTLIVTNDGSTDASFTMTVSGATIVDESGQVATPDSSMADESEAMDESATESSAAPADAAQPAAAPVAGVPAPASSSGVVIPPGLPIPAYYYDKPEFYIQYVDPALLAGATTASTTANTVIVGDAAPTEASESAEESVMAEETMSQSVSGTRLQGALGPDTIHYLGLVSNISDGNISLDLTFDPQDSREVNIFILNESDLATLNSSSRISDVAISAGNRVANGALNLRNASFRSSGLGNYTVLVRNSSTSASAEYTLVVEGGNLSDDSGQTSTAQVMAAESESDESDSAAPAAAPAPSVTVQTAAPAPAAAPVAAAPAQTTAPAAAPTSVIAVPTTGATAGQLYTIKSGDSISKIARDIYNDVKKYTQICEFNSVADCNRIEVGTTLRLPTQAEMTALAGGTALTAPAASSAAPAATTSTSSSATTSAATSSSSTTASSTTASSTTASSTTASSTTTSSTASSSSDAPALDIVDTAGASDNFTILVNAIDKAGLVPALRGNGPFTVFAPTDEAFNALPSSTLDTLLADPGGALTQILLYHVIPGQLLEQNLTDGLTAQTVEGRTVQFGVDRDSVTINDANLIVTDIKTSNGIIHVIDSVISPPASNAAASSSESAASTAPAETAENSAAEESAAEAPASNNASASAALASKLPVLSDVSSLSSEVNDGEVKVIYKTGSAIDEVADFYKAEMSRLDFRTTRAVITARAATLAFTGDDGNVRIGVTEDASSDAVIVELTVTAP